MFGHRQTRDMMYSTVRKGHDHTRWLPEHRRYGVRDTLMREELKRRGWPDPKYSTAAMEVLEHGGCKRWVMDEGDKQKAQAVWAKRASRNRIIVTSRP